MKALTFLSFPFLLYMLPASSQSIYTPPTKMPAEDFDNIYVEQIHSDSLMSSFYLIIKKEVPLHKHLLHTEHVYVLEGSGEMILGDNHISITQGDLIIIPQNTAHSLEVTSRDPVKLLSIQSPHFDGSDRIELK